MDCPSAGFLWAGREIGAKAEQMVGRADELAHATICDAEARKKFESFLTREFGEFAFDLGADDNRFAAEVLCRIVADGANVNGGGESPVRSARSFSPTLQAKRVGFAERRKNP